MSSVDVDIFKILLKNGKFPLYELSKMVCPGSGIALSVQRAIDKMKNQGLVVEKGHCVDLTTKGCERALLLVHG